MPTSKDGVISGPRSPGSTTSSSNRQPKTVLNGRYEIGEKLGQGGMGVVYRAVDRQQPDRPLAIKCIQGGSVSDFSLALFKAEFKGMSEIRHPNVARVYDFERIHGTDDHLFTMEFVDGANVGDAARGATPEAIAGMMVHACRALSHMHGRGQIHSDVKPSNMMTTSSGNLKMLDFGLVGVRAQEGMSQYAGTPAYLAPERLDATRQHDHRADLYSLGITWYELLCGRLPFQAESVSQLLELHRTAPLQFDDEARRRVPEWTQRIIERLCAKHPADRFRSGNAVIEAINVTGGLNFDIETSATRDSYFFAGRLVGREAQVTALSRFMDERLSDATAPREPVCLVAGTSGSGKSRLMLEIRHRAQFAHGVFAEADCYDGSLSEYEPVVSVVRHLIRLAEGIGAIDLLDQFAPSLALLDPQFGRGSALSVANVDNPDAARVAMITQVGEFMVAVADRMPYAVYMNDLQWARAGTLDTLLNLSRLTALRERGGRRVRLAILGSYRDDEVDGRPIEPWLRSLRDNHEVRSVRLDPLVRDEVSALVASMLGVPELPESFVDRITRETAGNPFFIGEVMRSLMERGLVYLEGGRWAADRPIGTLDFPASMSAWFERRLAQLDLRERDVLELIAAFGRPMPMALIAAVARLDDDGLLHIVMGLLRRQIIVRGTVGDESCCWPSHDRIRELAYAQTDPATRLQLHRAVAEALEARAGGDAPVEELARQWWAAEDREKALDYCIRGGRQAKRRHALETGIELMHHALDLLPKDDLAQRTALEDELAEMLALRGDFDRASAIYDRLLPRLANEVDRARVLLQLGSIKFRRGDTLAGRRDIWQSLKLLGESRPQWRPALLSRIALAAMQHFALRFIPVLRRRAPDQARSAVKADSYLALVYPVLFADPFECVLVVLRGANLAMRMGEGPQRSLAYSHLGFLFYGLVLGRFDTALKYIRRGRDLADAGELPLHRALAIQSEAFVRFMMGEWDAVGATALESARSFRAHGDVYCVGASYCMLVLSHLHRGALSTARQVAQEGLEIVERVGALAVSTPVSMKHGVLLCDLGQPDIGLPKLHAALEATERMGDPVLRAWVRIFLGHGYFAKGEIGVAIEYLESCVAVRKRFHLDADFLSNRSDALLARAYIESARQAPEPSERRALLGRARRHASAAMRNAAGRPTFRAEALLAMAESRWEDGDEAKSRPLFDQCIAFAEHRGSRMALADAHYELGRRERQPADARRHLQLALDLYDACEATAYMPKVRDALASVAQAK